MINRRFMIVPPALLSGGHAEQLEQTSKDFPCLLLEMANMRVPGHRGIDWLVLAGLERRQGTGIDQQLDAARDTWLASDEAFAFECDQHLMN
jgi:hypothetical protein